MNTNETPMTDWMIIAAAIVCLPIILPIAGFAYIEENFLMVDHRDSEGKYHCEDGPACYHRILKTGKWAPLYYWHGKPIACSSTKEFCRLVKLKAFW